MNNSFKISAYCSIKGNQMFLNGELVFETTPTLFSDFSKKAYTFLEENYPKFFKMDNLSKLAFIGSELLFKNYNFQDKENGLALVFANKHSSLDTDVKFQESISNEANYFPSPAVFVYTLPNICLGEISIKHQLKTENSFFIFENFNPDFMTNYGEVLLQTNKATSLLCGWVDYFNETYNAFFYIVAKSGTLEHTKEQLEIIYNK